MTSPRESCDAAATKAPRRLVSRRFGTSKIKPRSIETIVIPIGARGDPRSHSSRWLDVRVDRDLRVRRRLDVIDLAIEEKVAM